MTQPGSPGSAGRKARARRRLFIPRFNNRLIKLHFYLVSVAIRPRAVISTHAS